MATLKLKHLLMFLVTFGLLYLAEIPAGSLIALGCWMQLSILLWHKEFTATSQKKFFYLFLSLVPACFFWGSVNSFMEIYLQEGHWVFLSMICTISFILCFWITLIGVFGYKFETNEDNLSTLYGKCIAEIKNQKKVILQISLIVFVISLIPKILSADYKIVLGLIVAHAVMRRSALKLAVGHSDVSRVQKP